MSGGDNSGGSNPVIVQNVQDSLFPTGVVLDESNYPTWSQLMEMRIGARNKSGFLTGKAVKPTTNEKALEAWITDDNKVRSWLIDSMSPTLMHHFIRLKTAAEIWDAVSKMFYDGSDETQLFELNRKTFITRQNGRPLPTCYNELVSLFQEIDTRMNDNGNNVEATVAVNKALSRFRVHIFLAGLDPDFNQVKSESLRKDPPLSLEACYAYIRKDLNQRQAMDPIPIEPDSVVNKLLETDLQKPRGLMKRVEIILCVLIVENRFIQN